MILNDHKNIIVHQIEYRNDKYSFNEVKPTFCDLTPDYFLSLDTSLNLIWTKYKIPLELQEGSNIKFNYSDNKLTINASLNIDTNFIKDSKFKDTDIYYVDGKLGIGISPRFTYKFDINIPANTLITGFHIGDGSYGFSMGNGTSNGFIPQIIGMGADENDTGLYLLGRCGNNETSDIPLIIIDGRSNDNGPLQNRPIFGITSGNYDNYKILLDQYGRLGIGLKPETYKLEVNGSVKADNFIIKDYSLKDLINVISSLQKQVNELSEQLNKPQIISKI